jgi:tetratricopeptide (TPR) repeat protein
MDEIEPLYAEADRRRVNGHRPEDFRAAIRMYELYISRGGPNKRVAQQMMGVCHQRLKEYGRALECYHRALKGASDYERANIKRDMAESYRALRSFEMAEGYLAEALLLLPLDEYPNEHGATLGFRGRVRHAQGRMSEALEDFSEAHRLLVAGGNRSFELYNLLNFADACHWAGRHAQARNLARQALRLSLSKDPRTGRRYGSRAHHLRAIRLFLGFQ